MLRIRLLFPFFSNCGVYQKDGLRSGEGRYVFRDKTKWNPVARHYAIATCICGLSDRQRCGNSRETLVFIACRCVSADIIVCCILGPPFTTCSKNTLQGTQLIEVFLLGLADKDPGANQIQLAKIFIPFLQNSVSSDCVKQNFIQNPTCASKSLSPWACAGARKHQNMWICLFFSTIGESYLCWIRFPGLDTSKTKLWVRLNTCFG